MSGPRLCAGRAPSAAGLSSNGSCQGAVSSGTVTAAATAAPATHSVAAPSLSSLMVTAAGHPSLVQMYDCKGTRKCCCLCLRCCRCDQAALGRLSIVAAPDALNGSNAGGQGIGCNGPRHRHRDGSRGGDRGGQACCCFLRTSIPSPQYLRCYSSQGAGLQGRCCCPPPPHRGACCHTATGTAATLPPAAVVQQPPVPSMAQMQTALRLSAQSVAGMSGAGGGGGDDDDGLMRVPRSRLSELKLLLRMAAICSSLLPHRPGLPAFTHCRSCCPAASCGAQVHIDQSPVDSCTASAASFPIQRPCMRLRQLSGRSLVLLL